MPNTIARGQISFVDLNDGKTLNFVLTANQPSTQIFTPNATEQGPSYNPDYTQSPNLVIIPEIYVSGYTGDQATQLDNVSWLINGSPISSATGYSDSVVYYDADGHRYSNDHPFALKIVHNITGAHIKVECSADYVDPDTGLSTPVKGEITFTKTENAGSSIICVVTTPGGNIFRNNDIAYVYVHATLWRGSKIDESDVEYTWFRRDAEGADNSWVQITDAATGGVIPQFVSDKSPATVPSSTVNFTNKNCNQIKIPASSVINYDLFKCVIKDVDNSSDTKNVEVSDFASVLDFTDPYMVSFETPAGTVLAKGQDSSTTTVTLWQNGAEVASTFYSSCTFTWTKYDKNGDVVTNWGTGGHKTGRSLTVTRAEISVSATFSVEITIS